jgi:hypothetical protein
VILVLPTRSSEMLFGILRVHIDSDTSSGWSGMIDFLPSMQKCVVDLVGILLVVIYVEPARIQFMYCEIVPLLQTFGEC